MHAFPQAPWPHSVGRDVKWRRQVNLALFLNIRYPKIVITGTCAWRYLYIFYVYWKKRTSLLQWTETRFPCLPFSLVTELLFLVYPSWTWCGPLIMGYNVESSWRDFQPGQQWFMAESIFSWNCWKTSFLIIFSCPSSTIQSKVDWNIQIRLSEHFEQLFLQPPG
jgi:hypothetical protein